MESILLRLDLEIARMLPLRVPHQRSAGNEALLYLVLQTVATYGFHPRDVQTLAGIQNAVRHTVTLLRNSDLPDHPLADFEGLLSLILWAVDTYGLYPLDIPTLAGLKIGSSNCYPVELKLRVEHVR